MKIGVLAIKNKLFPVLKFTAAVAKSLEIISHVELFHQTISLFDVRLY